MVHIMPPAARSRRVTLVSGSQGSPLGRIRHGNHVGTDPRGTVLEEARLPDLVRGFEDIKLAGGARFRERAGEVQRELEEGRAR